MHESSASNQQATIFKTYLASQKIVIADPSTASRAGLAKAMIDLGAKMNFISLVGTYEEAEAAIQKNKPSVIVCDFMLGKRCGLDLLQEQRANNPDAKKSLFVLVTGNTSQSAVAQAAEEDVDTFILKPYTLEVLKRSILKAAIAKLSPTAYAKKIEDGKAQMASGDLDGAIKTFEEATHLDPKPALAHFYHGQTLQIKKAFEEAAGDYNTGLNINKIHYKCLTGLFDLLLSQKKNVDAYDVVKRISRYFPANPQRLNQVLRLAILTQSFEDIERYYQAFTTIDNRNDELVRYVCAALVVTGKFYLQKSFHSRALELFEKAGMTAAGRPKILREIIEALMQYQMSKDAETFLKRFPPAAQSQVDYLAMEYLVQTHSMPPTVAVERGRRLIGAEHHDPVIYTKLIQASLECNLADAAEDLVRKGAEKWPNKKAALEAILATKGKAAAPGAAAPAGGKPAPTKSG